MMTMVVSLISILCSIIMVVYQVKFAFKTSDASGLKDSVFNPYKEKIGSYLDSSFTTEIQANLREFYEDDKVKKELIRFGEKFTKSVEELISEDNKCIDEIEFQRINKSNWYFVSDCYRRLYAMVYRRIPIKLPHTFLYFIFLDLKNNSRVPFFIKYLLYFYFFALFIGILLIYVLIIPHTDSALSSHMFLINEYVSISLILPLVYVWYRSRLLKWYRFRRFKRIRRVIVYTIFVVFLVLVYGGIFLFSGPHPYKATDVFQGKNKTMPTGLKAPVSFHGYNGFGSIWYHSDSETPVSANFNAIMTDPYWYTRSKLSLMPYSNSLKNGDKVKFSLSKQFITNANYSNCSLWGGKFGVVTVHGLKDISKIKNLNELYFYIEQKVSNIDKTKKNDYAIYANYIQVHNELSISGNEVDIANIKTIIINNTDGKCYIHNISDIRINYDKNAFVLSGKNSSYDMGFDKTSADSEEPLNYINADSAENEIKHSGSGKYVFLNSNH